MTDKNLPMSEIEVEIPAWVNEFMECVSQAYEIGNPSDKAIAWKWWFDEHEDTHEVLIYPSLVEIDGVPCVPGDIHIDVASIIDQFEQISDITLTLNNNVDDDLLAIAGKVNGQDVYLHLLDGPPEDEVPISRMCPDGTIEDIEPSTEGPS